MNKVWMTVALLTLAACAGTPPAEAPYLLKESARLNKLGGKAHTRGDHLRALDLSRAAYRGALAIDRIDEAVDELINQGVLLRKLDRRDEAIDVVTRGWGMIEDDRAMGYKTSADMSYDDEEIRLAILGGDLSLDVGKVDQAPIWIERGERACRRSACTSGGAFVNLRARAKWDEGAKEEAVALGREALSVNRKNKNRLEEGHSLRLLGRWEDDPAVASKHFRAALVIDRALAIPTLIIDDLIGVGTSLQRQGKEGQAKRYFTRARAIAGSIDDEKRKSRCDTLLGLTSAP